MQLQNDPMNTQLIQKEKAQRDHCIKLLTSVIDIIRQQCKAEWLTYGDDCRRYFFARAKQLLYTFMNCKMNKVEFLMGFQQ